MVVYNHTSTLYRDSLFVTVVCNNLNETLKIDG